MVPSHARGYTDPVTGPLPAVKRGLYRHRRFLGLLALFLVLRLLMALSSVVSLDDEDGFTMSAVVELLGDGSWPWYAYQISDWENGSLLVVLLAVPWYLLLGHSLLALQLTGITVGAVTLTALYMLCRRAFGVRVALLASLLYVCFPAPVMTYNLVAHGFHPDSVALQLLFLWSMCRALDVGRARDYLLCGALGGLAVYFAYISVFCVAGGALALALTLWRRRSLVRLAPFVAGLALGVAPLVAYNLATSFAGVGMSYNTAHGDLGDGTFLGYLVLFGLENRLEIFWNHGLLAFFHFSNYGARDDHLLTVLNVGYWQAALVAMGAALVAAARRRRLPHAVDLTLLGATLMTLYVFMVSGHPLGVQHTVPLLVLHLPSVTARGFALWDHGGRAARVALACALCAFLGLGLSEGLSLIVPGRLGISQYVDGRNHSQFYQQQRLKRRKRNRPTADLDRYMLALPLERARVSQDPGRLDPHVLYYTTNLGPLFTALTADKGESRPPAEVWARFLEGLAVRGRSPAYFARAGFLLGTGMVVPPGTPEDNVGRDVLKTARALTKKRGKAHRVAMLRGLGFGTLRPEMKDHLKWQPWPRAATAQIVFGHGRAHGLLRLMNREEPLCGDWIPAAHRDIYMRGVGAGLRCNMVGELPQMVLRRICARRQAAFKQGWSAARCGDL